MSGTNPPRVQERYTSDDFDRLGFHDCHLSGAHWNSDTFEVTFEIDYIVKWLEPTAAEQAYRFWVSPAELCFMNVDDLHLELAWDGLALDCSVQELHRQEMRTTPNGMAQWKWELEFSVPEGRIVFWATDFELRIKNSPTLSATQRLCRK